MVSASSDPPDPNTSADAGRRLESWKEIAAYFERNERTVRRWEKTEGLPVRRHLHDIRGSVFAYAAELDAWRAGRATGLKQPPQEARSRSRWWPVTAFCAVLAVAAVTMLATLLLRRPAEGEPTHLQPLTSYPGSELHPSFSPDGKQLAFAWDGGAQDQYDIYVKTIGVEAPRRITADPADEISPSWSPDGRWIAFLRVFKNVGAAICLIPSTGGAERTLTEVAEPRGGATLGPYIAWSPDSASLIVPDRATGMQPFGLVQIAIDNGRKRKLTSPPAPPGDMAIAVSPSGRSVAFIRGMSYAASELYLMPIPSDARTQPRERRVTSFGRLTTSPAWTPDENYLYFLSADFKSTETELWRMAGSGGGTPVLVTQLGERARHLTISRQKRLAFIRRVSDANIWRVQARVAEGGRSGWMKSVFISSTRKDRNAQYSPDGKQISFESDRSGSIEIWKCERDGSNAIRLTNVGGPDVCCSRWSPDGRHLVFVSYPRGRASVYVVDSNGGSPRRITDDRYNSNTPSWSNDGQWIYFSSNRGSRPQIWKIPVNGGEPVQITKEGGVLALESADSKTLYYTKGGARSMSLWRMPAEGGDEKQILDGLISYNTFAVTQNGIYLLLLPEAGDTGGTISFLDFRTGRLETITELDRTLRSGLSIMRGPAGRVIEMLYTQADHEGEDLVISGSAR